MSAIINNFISFAVFFEIIVLDAHIDAELLYPETWSYFCIVFRAQDS
jgi:hypothetical protein